MIIDTTIEATFKHSSLGMTGDNGEEGRHRSEGRGVNYRNRFKRLYTTFLLYKHKIIGSRRVEKESDEAGRPGVQAGGGV